MKIVQLISENKKTRRKTGADGKPLSGLYSSKAGFYEAIVEENGKLKTKHLVKQQ